MTQDRNPPPRSRPGRSRRVHGYCIWQQARTEYLSGDSAGRVCKRHGLNLSTFYDRAKRDGWRRLDVLEDRVWTEGDERNLDESWGAMGARAWRHAARSIARGSRAEARSWLLVARDLERSGLKNVYRQPRQTPAAAPAFRSRRPDDSEPYGQSPTPETSNASTPCPAPSDNTERTDSLSTNSPLSPRGRGAGGEGAPAAPAPADDPALLPEPPTPPAACADPEAPPEPPPLPWAALQARPEAHCTPEERALRGRFLRRLDRLAEQDRPAAERAWAEWSAKYGVDPGRPPGPPVGAPVETWIGGFRVIRP